MTTAPAVIDQPRPSSPDPRWAAVLDRDPSYDGAFVFAVRSTGIYCRASCPARRPRPEQVRFFSTPAAAERHGYRPCKRCRPHQPAAATAVERACRYLEAHGERRVPLAELAQAVGLGPSHLHRTFKRELGVTPRQYAEAQRLRQFKSGVTASGDLLGAIYHAGYGSSSRLYEQAPAALGMTPATYRKRGAGLAIRYSIVATDLGRLLVAATERGICAVSLGASDAELEQGLRAEYPAAAITHDGTGLHAHVTAVLRHINGDRPAPDLPLDIQATAFQRRVWQALQTIPRGATRSYQEVAQRVGNPGAARAVAQACASNPVAVVIPCHRVVRSDGGLGGYRWGFERKHALLDRERAGTEIPATG
jgi:AraC family transcriptional regulator of adaptative response/methylated-DNA-[protein]-cysteine methyltransferase